jgi:hypothetical protein
MLFPASIRVGKKHQSGSQKNRENMKDAGKHGSTVCHFTFCSASGWLAKLVEAVELCRRGRRRYKALFDGERSPYYSCNMNSRQASRFALLFFFLFTLTLSAGTPPANRYWGICSNLESEAIADKVSGLGVGWVRLGIWWQQVEQRRGVFNWDIPDIEIGRAVERGLNVFITIHGTPSWANGGKSHQYPPNRSSYWVNFVTATAKRYGRYPQVRAIGMWNEPNLPGFWMGTPEEYISKILIPGSQAVKKAKPSLLVGAPELSDDWIHQPEWHIQKFLNSGATINVVTQHVYRDLFDGNDFADFIDTWVRPYRGRRPVWITEAGHHVCYQYVNGELLQDLYYRYILDVQQKRKGWFTKIFTYRIWDPDKSCASGGGWGITYGPFLRERDAYATYKRYIQSRL